MEKRLCLFSFCLSQFSKETERVKTPRKSGEEVKLIVLPKIKSPYNIHADQRLNMKGEICLETKIV